MEEFLRVRKRRENWFNLTGNALGCCGAAYLLRPPRPSPWRLLLALYAGCSGIMALRALTRLIETQKKRLFIKK